MSHFGYGHLPASGLGLRDPLRPYVTGGIGAGIPIFVTRIDERRIYGFVEREAGEGERDPDAGDRVYLDANNRILTAGDRVYVEAERTKEGGDRVPSDAERSPVTPGDRIYAAGDRVYLDEEDSTETDDESEFS